MTTGKNSEKKLRRLLLMFYILITGTFVLILKNYILPTFQNTIQSVKASYSRNDYKKSRMALYRSKKTI